VGLPGRSRRGDAHARESASATRQAARRVYERAIARRRRLGWRSHASAAVINNEKRPPQNSWRGVLVCPYGRYVWGSNNRSSAPRLLRFARGARAVLGPELRVVGCPGLCRDRAAHTPQPAARTTCLAPWRARTKKGGCVNCGASTRQYTPHFQKNPFSTQYKLFFFPVFPLFLFFIPFIFPEEISRSFSASFSFLLSSPPATQRYFTSALRRRAGRCTSYFFSKKFL